MRRLSLRKAAALGLMALIALYVLAAIVVTFRSNSSETAAIQRLTRLNARLTWNKPVLIGDHTVASISFGTENDGRTILEIDDFRAIGDLTSLSSIDMSTTNLSDSNIAYIISGNLQRCQLQSTDISDLSVTHLLMLRNVNYLDIRDTRITSKGMAELLERFPKSQIFWSPRANSDENK